MQKLTELNINGIKANGINHRTEVRIREWTLRRRGDVVLLTGTRSMRSDAIDERYVIGRSAAFYIKVDTI